MRIIVFLVFKVPYLRELPDKRISKNEGLLGLHGGLGIGRLSKSKGPPPFGCQAQKPTGLPSPRPPSLPSV